VPGRRVWRVYFNSHAAAPLVWCIAPATVGDEVGYEIAVADVVIHGASTAVYRGGDAQPKAWMEAVGYLEIDSAGVASILRQPRSE
jgi:hypothetical protein